MHRHVTGLEDGLLGGHTLRHCRRPELHALDGEGLIRCSHIGLVTILIVRKVHDLAGGRGLCGATDSLGNVEGLVSTLGLRRVHLV